MANLYANIAQLGRPDELQACMDMVTFLPAKLMNLGDYGIAVGNPADIVVLDCVDPISAVSELAQPLLAMKRGRISFSRPAAAINGGHQGLRCRMTFGAAQLPGRSLSLGGSGDLSDSPRNRLAVASR